MNKLEDFIISNPYTLTNVDREAIRHASPDEPLGDHWFNPCLSQFKKRIRKYVLKQQNGLCAYCRLELHENEATPEIEHIVPKNLKPKWMYEPYNLCVSCKMCNTKKGYTKQVLMDETVEQLPLESNDYKLIHPYFDRYSDYIELVDGILYKGIDTKGQYTIFLCELNRYEVAAERAKKFLEKDINFHTRFLLLLQDEENKRLLQNVDSFLESITDIIERFKFLNKV